MQKLRVRINRWFEKGIEVEVYKENPKTVLVVMPGTGKIIKRKRNRDLITESGA